MDAQPYPFSDVVEARKQTPSTAKAINVQIGPGDPISNVPVVIEFDHHQVHEGEVYRAEDYQSGLGSSTIKYAIVVPSFTSSVNGPHIIMGVDVYNGNVLVQVYENATYTGGTPLGKNNRNRNSLNTAKTTFFSGVTSTNGTLLHTAFVGAGKSGSDSARAAVEYILKANTTYRVDIIGRAAGTESIVDFDFYEDLGI